MTVFGDGSAMTLRGGGSVTTPPDMGSATSFVAPRVGPVFERGTFVQIVRVAVSLGCDGFAFTADSSLSAGDLRRGRELWEQAGLAPPLAVLPVEAAMPAEAEAALSSEAEAALSAAVARALQAGAWAVVTSAQSTMARPALEAAALPLLWRLQPADLDDPARACANLAARGHGWCLDPATLWQQGWWHPPQLMRLGRHLQLSGLPGAIWLAEPGGARFDQGEMGGRWWDVLSQSWTRSVPIYVQGNVRKPVDYRSELHNVQQLLQASG